MVHDKVEMGEEQGPPRLATIQLLGSHEILQILVVHPDLTPMLCPFHEMSPLLQLL